MQPFAPRAGRLPLALALTLTALTALTACSDDPVAPKTPGPVAAKIALVAAASAGREGVGVTLSTRESWKFEP